MTLGEWIKQYRKSHGLSMQAFADMSGLSKAYIGMIEKGVNPTTGKTVSPTIQTIGKIAKGVNVDLDTFLKELDAQQPVTINRPTIHAGYKIPVRGNVAAGTPINAVEEILGYQYLEDTYKDDGCSYFALRIQGRSMEPTIMDGDTVIVRQQSSVDNGEIAIVLVDGEDATAKEIKENANGITLIGHNTTVYTPHFYSVQEIHDLPIQIIGRVIEVRRKL